MKKVLLEQFKEALVDIRFYDIGKPYLECHVTTPVCFYKIYISSFASKKLGNLLTRIHA